MGFAIQLLNHRNKYFLFFVFTLLQAQESIDSIVFKMNQHAQPVDIEMEIKVTLNSKNKKITKDSHYRLMNHLEKRYEDGKFKSKLLLRFIEPKEVRGLALLNWNWIDELKNDQWLYVPRLRKVKRIKPSESSRKFQGTEFTYGDIIEGDMVYENYKFFKKDYCFGSECYLLKRDSKNSRIIWVDDGKYLIRKIEYFNKDGIKIRILEIPEYVKNNSYWTPVKRIMRNLENGNSTTLEVIKVEYDQGLKDSSFSEKYLKRLKF
jgi:hypothetical protein